MTRVCCDKCGDLDVVIEERAPEDEVINMTEAKRRSEALSPTWPPLFQYRCRRCEHVVIVNTNKPPFPPNRTLRPN